MKLNTLVVYDLRMCMKMNCVWKISREIIPREIIMCMEWGYPMWF